MEFYLDRICERLIVTPRELGRKSKEVILVQKTAALSKGTRTTSVMQTSSGRDGREFAPDSKLAEPKDPRTHVRCDAMVDEQAGGHS
jgi:hypothetical protein